MEYLCVVLVALEGGLAKREKTTQCDAEGRDMAQYLDRNRKDNGMKEDVARFRIILD